MTVVPFFNNLSSDTSSTHPTGATHSHDHGGEHGHTHEHLDHAGKYSDRDMPDYSSRNFDERGFTIGIGG